jgi:hypothetical protein
MAAAVVARAELWRKARREILSDMFDESNADAIASRSRSPSGRTTRKA